MFVSQPAGEEWESSHRGTHTTIPGARWHFMNWAMTIYPNLKGSIDRTAR